MKKYNLSEIMHTAWKLYRKGTTAFAECLHRAWNSAKALFQVVLIHSSKGDGQTYRASFFGASQVKPLTSERAASVISNGGFLFRTVYTSHIISFIISFHLSFINQKFEKMIDEMRSLFHTAA